MKPQINQSSVFPLITAIVFLLFSQEAYSQKGLTLNNALDIAENNSPSIRRSRLGLIRSQENLNAQRAALKSAFSLTINPVAYSQGRTLSEQFAAYTTTQNFSTSAVFNVVQPIVATDATIRLTNTLAYNDFYLKREVPFLYESATKGFDNRLNLRLDQPI